MKKFIVTDPGYFMYLKSIHDSRNEIWKKFCEYDNNGEYYKSEQFLRESLGLNFLEICSTGYGDWSNSIFSYSNKIYNQKFYADSGLVCVAEYTEEMESENIPGAVFETEKIRFIDWNEDDPSWTVLNIHTEEGSVWSTEPENDWNEEDDYSHLQK